MVKLAEKPAAIALRKLPRYWLASFEAMAGPCWVYVDHDDESMVRRVAQLAWNEAKRIEHKFSRYRDDNIVYRINHAHGKPIEVDPETAFLLDYAAQCFALSDGLFDITSGVLRKAWHILDQKRLPDRQIVQSLLESVGWEKVRWEKSFVTLQPDMEIDFGGIGKEYAVDRTADIVGQVLSTGVLINYGGDLRAIGPLRNGESWEVALEQDGESNGSVQTVSLSCGAITTSGNTRRYFVHEGKRYGHIIHPKTGYPVEDAPLTVTVMADTCLEAGMLSTFAMLKGADAEAFLQVQGVPHFVYRESISA